MGRKAFAALFLAAIAGSSIAYAGEDKAPATIDLEHNANITYPPPLPREKPAKKAGPPKNIGWRPGGDVLNHVSEASKMILSGRSYRVTGDQYSAAAMQVLFIESQYPDRICATRRVKLHFHLGYDMRAKKRMKEMDWAWIAFMRPENVARLGKLPQYGKGWRTVKGSEFLGLCKKGS